MDDDDDDQFPIFQDAHQKPKTQNNPSISSGYNFFLKLFKLFETL